MTVNPNEAPAGYRAVPYKDCDECAFAQKQCLCNRARCLFDEREDRTACMFDKLQPQPDLVNAATAVCEWGKVPVDKCEHCAEFSKPAKPQTVTISAELAAAYVGLFRACELLENDDNNLDLDYLSKFLDKVRFAGNASK